MNNDKPITLTPDEFAARFAPLPSCVSSICMLASRLTNAKQLAGGFAVTEKLDGVRCIAIRRGESVQLFTRNGNPINGAQEVRAAISALTIDLVLDGELIADPLPGESRKQVYERTRSAVRAGRNGLTFHVFDVLTPTEFDCRTSCYPYAKRRELLNVIATRLANTSAVKVVPVLYMGHDVDIPGKLMETICANGGEGVMVNLLNAPYHFSRCTDLLKLKPHREADLRVLDIVEGTGKNAGSAGAIIVDYKGNRVGVGSGISVKLRKTIWLYRNAYIGRIATIRFTEESANVKGGLSLRFPVFVEFREPGKIVSYD